MATIHEAAARGDLSELERLVAAVDANIDALDHRGLTPLLWAVREGQEAAVEVLLAAGADPNLGLRPDYSPLPLAVRLSEHEIARRIASSPAIDLRAQGLVAADEALIWNDDAALALLADAGFDFRGEAPGDRGPTGAPNVATALVFTAIALGLPRRETLTFLYAHGGDPHFAGEGVDTALIEHARAVNAAPEVATLLLERGIPVDAADVGGTTALAFAAANGNAELATLLLSEGADPLRTDRQGRTPLDLAAGRGDAVHSVLRAALKRSEEPGAGHLQGDRDSLPPSLVTLSGLAETRFAALSLHGQDGAWVLTGASDSAETVQRNLAARHGSSRAPQGPHAVVELLELTDARNARPELVSTFVGTLELNATIPLVFVAHVTPAPGRIGPLTYPDPPVPRFVLLAEPDAHLPEQAIRPSLRVRLERILMFEDGMVLEHPGIAIEDAHRITATGIGAPIN